MSHPTDWDAERYRSASESSEQWSLRKSFIERWKAEVPEERLVCLSRVFANVEFLGCRYPEPTMRRVAAMSEDVARKYREVRRSRLKRTFVSAADAAAERAKGAKRSENGNITFAPQKSIDAQNRNAFTLNRSKNTLAYGGLILMDKHPEENLVQKISVSCGMCKIPLDWQCVSDGENWTCKCVVNGAIVSETAGETKKTAKENAARTSWDILRRDCHTIVTIRKHASKEDRKISVRDVEHDSALPESGVRAGLDVKVDSAIGLRMMKMMGWKGGALGSSENGISEPIKPHLKQICRTGLGSSTASASVMKSVEKIIIEFKKENDPDYDLVFANDFTKEERAQMHKVALRSGLKSKSYGKDADRYLVISKSLTPEQLLRSLMDCGGVNDKYQLVPPTR